MPRKLINPKLERIIRELDMVQDDIHLTASKSEYDIVKLDIIIHWLKEMVI